MRNRRFSNFSRSAVLSSSSATTSAIVLWQFIHLAQTVAGILSKERIYRFLHHCLGPEAVFVLSLDVLVRVDKVVCKSHPSFPLG
jgi:hypothetical protein